MKTEEQIKRRITQLKEARATLKRKGDVIVNVAVTEALEWALKTVEWEYVESVKIGRYTITKHSPVNIMGKRGVWRVISIQKHQQDGRVNVEVVNADGWAGVSRHFALDKVKYVRPSSARGQRALGRA